jgi:hypothetical protein
MILSIAVFYGLFACSGDAKPDTVEPPPPDSGTDTDDTAAPNEDCEAVISETRPSDGQSNWFYRDSVRLTFSEINPSVSAIGTDSSGNEVPLSFEWNDSREMAYLLPESGFWMGNENYTLNIDYCGNTASMSFSTSSYGSPLEVNVSELVDKTYNIDLASATYSQPPGIDIILGNNIDQPLLFGVEAATETAIDFVAALGVVDNFGAIEQSSGLWFFPNADFTGSPYFDAFADYLAIDYNGIAIPIHNFRISGTFSPDGNMIGMAAFSGLGDTRELGPAFLPNGDEDTICGILEPLGSECEACPGDDSGGSYCIFLSGTIDEVSFIPNLILEDM